MKGLRTLLINGVVVVVTALLTWAAGVDWSQYVSPTVAMVILAGVNFALRFVTDTPVFKSTVTVGAAIAIGATTMIAVNDNSVIALVA